MLHILRKFKVGLAGSTMSTSIRSAGDQLYLIPIL